MIWKRGMVLNRDPRGGQYELVRERKTFLQPVTDLRPAKTHFALEAQRTRQPAHPPPADNPRAADADEQDDPGARGIDDLHYQGEQPDQGEDFGIQPDGGIHG